MLILNINIDFEVKDILLNWNNQELKYTTTDHKYKHNFADSLNPICNRGTDIETIFTTLLHRPNF